jgi:hypothetical protein
MPKSLAVREEHRLKMRLFELKKEDVTDNIHSFVLFTKFYQSDQIVELM